MSWSGNEPDYPDGDTERRWLLFLLGVLLAVILLIVASPWIAQWIPGW